MVSRKQSPRASRIGLSPVVASGLVCFCAGALYGWSALITPIQTTFDISLAQTGLIFSLAIVSFTCAVIAVPLWTCGNANPRIVGGIGVIGAICLVAATQASAFITFLFWFSGGFGAASGGVYIAALGVASAARRHTIATPAMVAAFGLGGAVFGPVWRQLDEAGWGLQALLPLAVLLLGVSLISALATKGTAPYDHGSLVFKKDTNPQMMRLIWVLFALGSFGGLMVLGLGAKMMDAAGANSALASLGLAGIAIGNTGGRLSVAWFRGRIGMAQILLCAMVLTLIGLILAALFSSAAAVCIGLFLVALGYGIVASTVPVLTRDIFDAGQFQRRFALIFTAWGAAGFLAPWVGGALYDWRQSFTLPLVVAMFAALLCCLIVRRSKLI